MNNVIEVCAYIHDYCKEKGYSMPYYKLQALIYLTQALFVIKYNRECFDSPLFYCEEGIKNLEVESRYRMGVPKFIYDISEEDKKDIQSVVDNFSSYSENKMISIVKNQPLWKINYDYRSNKIVNLEDIIKYYKK